MFFPEPSYWAETFLSTAGTAVPIFLQPWEIKQDSNKIVFPNLGGPEDWILAGIVDASRRTFGNLFDVDGQVIMLINEKNRAAFTIHKKSEKIE